MTTIRVAQILSSVLDGATEETDLSHRFVLACTNALPVTGVGLALMTGDGHAGTVAVSDEPAAAMEELQFTLGEGPCMECSATDRPVLQPDLARTGPGRWPEFSSGALGVGIRAIFALPLQVGAIRLGVLDLYRDTIGDLTTDELTEALDFADAATALLLHLQGQTSLEGPGLGGIEVIEDRAEIHQATGMISVQGGMKMADALVRLRARAYASERPILEIAHDVLVHRISFDPSYDGDDENDGR